MSETSKRVLTRREALLLSATAGITMVAGEPALASDSIKTAAHQEPGNVSTPGSAVAKTQYGRVRGFLDGGVFTFKGVPYGQTTAGANRWLPAKPPTPWTDEYPALVYGANCPQNLHTWTSAEQTFIQDWDDGWQSEDMLKLNIWTPSLTGKRPVMFYIHGGGYSFGSSYELPSHEGAQMARHHDVVQISVNHRLNILGFFDLSEIGGSAYEGSANVGMTDLVAALRWVRENIENFGGDPDRVMIYGQSGGGSKVTTLMGMPSAAGLFHRAAALSGGGGNIPSREQQAEVAKLVMKDLGLAPNDVESLQKMEWSKLIAAGNAAAAKINPPGPPMMGPGAPGKPRVGWQPCVDGKIINMRSFFDAAPENSKNVPLIVGSVTEEGNRMSSRPTEEEWHASLAKAYGEDKAAAIVAGLKKAYPKKKIQTLSYMCSGSPGLNGLAMRNNVVKMARLKHELNAAPAYAYYFTWQTPILDGLPGAWHTADLQFCFDNTKRCEQGTGNTPEAQSLAKKMASSWATFAATGNPSIPGLKWEATDPETNKTMVWDNECRMVNDPDGEIRKIIQV
ncbi:carboxylesterase/lipase family protein [Occallatibacter riparius]|uniref:Carboxylic ester hydrolase n=1 Tax=Occallatibacter riparius TaxID=1002689 RepID=A0A9J7BTC2_9BACT|nr:carboxylesterase family protein [Occallatibacter riparius]UWZ84150.1 carboxylesterase family protein [Occallatibacter riparius]